MAPLCPYMASYLGMRSQFFFCHACVIMTLVGVAGCDLFLQRDSGRLSRAVYHILECLWEVESTLPAILSH